MPQIKCGSAEFLLKGLDPVDFPDDPLFESKRKIRLTQPELGRMIDYVSTQSVRTVPAKRFRAFCSLSKAIF